MYVDRDNEGAITATYGIRQREGQEQVPDDDAEVAAFLAKWAEPPAVANEPELEQRPWLTPPEE